MYSKLLFALLFISFSSQAQKNIKGSRNVKTEQTLLEAFHTIEINGEYEVSLIKGSRYMVEVEADDNLHSVIEIDVKNNILSIESNKDIKASKTQKLRITFSDSLSKIIVAGKVDFVTGQDLTFTNFHFVAKEKSKSKFTIKADKFTLDAMEDAKVEAEVNAEEIFLHLNGSSDLDGYLKSELLNAEAFENSSAKLKGEASQLVLNASKSSKFDAEKFIAKEAEVFADGNSKSAINVSEDLKITAKDNSEVSIYNHPEIDLVAFSDKATLLKKS